jgi:uncharacterized RDD family membrane protein YckC
MENIAVETTQNVDIEYPVAGIPERIAAALLDFVIIFAYILVVSFIYSAIKSATYSYKTSPVAIAFLIVLYLPALLYSLLFETFMNGQSIGKRVLRIKVMRLDGRQPSFGNYVMRWVLRIVDILPLPFPGLIAIIVLAFNDKGQRLGDMAAGTMVIKIKRKETINKTAFQQVQDDYIPLYPEVTMLTDREINIVKRALLIYSYENRDEVQEKLVVKLTEYLGIQPKEDTNRSFLKALMKDYNKIHGRG